MFKRIHFGDENGSALIESAATLTAFLTIFFGVMDCSRRALYRPVCWLRRPGGGSLCDGQGIEFHRHKLHRHGHLRLHGYERKRRSLRGQVWLRSVSTPAHL